jgi:hypothetical protein
VAIDNLTIKGLDIISQLPIYRSQQSFLQNTNSYNICTDKKEKKIFLKYKEIQSGIVAKSYVRKGFLIFEEMRKYFSIYED